MLTDTLRRAYRATSYTVEADGRGLVARLDQMSPDIDTLLAARGARQGVFIVAWNPGSERRDDAANRAAHAELVRVLAARKLAWAPHVGQGDDGWREEGCFVLDLDDGAARGLALRFGQTAVVRIARGEPATLLLADPSAGSGEGALRTDTVPRPRAGLCAGSDRFTLLAHGGVGMVVANRKRQADYIAALLDIAREDLAAGARGLDVVGWVLATMENSGLYNAGRGSNPNRDGVREMDAAIMDGRTLKAGSVAGVVNIANPILAARQVMEETENVLFVGAQAERLLGATNAPPGAPVGDESKPWGTIGAVALDRDGNLCAGTTTGGFGAKIPGRVGDTPIIGAGTYANNATLAVSATGHGESFMRHVASYEAHALMRHAGFTLQAALNHVIHEVLAPVEGRGGVIAVARDGSHAWSFDTPAMIRGAVTHLLAPVAAFD